MIKIANHKNLNPKLFYSDGRLKPEAREILSRVYLSVMSMMSLYTKIPIDLDSDVIDVIICGSGAEYFYTKGSDLDIKIVIRNDRYLSIMDENIYIKFTKFLRSSFLDKYAPMVSGMKLDIGIVNKIQDMPNYSILNNRWNLVPKRFTQPELKYIKHKSNLIYMVMCRNGKRILKEKDHHAAILFYNYLKSRRSISWSEEFKNRSPFSLAFSRFNRKGYIEKLLKLDEINIKKLIFSINKEYLI